MNASPNFRYYLAFVLLVLLGFAIRVQNGADVTEHATVRTAIPTEAPATLLARH